MEYCGVFPKDLALGVLWPQASALLERAIPHGKGEFEIDDIRSGIEAGEMFLAGVIVDGVVEFVVSCVLIQTPRKSILYIQYGAGRGGARARDALVRAAKTLNADWIETRCRDAVAALYRRVGFDTAYRVCILEIPR